MQDIDYSKLKIYFKNLSVSERTKFAQQCHTTLNYMNKRISLKKPFGYRIAKSIYQVGIMQPQELRPSDWRNFQWD